MPETAVTAMSFVMLPISPVFNYMTQTLLRMDLMSSV